MALELSFNTCVANNCRSIFFNETTGLYNATTNPTGWGSPNILLSEVTETHIIITLPGDVVVDILNPVGLPTDTDSVEYEISFDTLDSNWTVIQDGLYTIEYTVTDGIDIYTTTPLYFLYTCNTACCVAKLFAKIATSTDCSCDSTIIKNALYAFAILKSLESNKDCGNASAIDALLDKLNQICGFSTTNCGCN